MHLEEITENKRRFLPLLLVGDEQESMIDRYLEGGKLYALYDGGLRAVGVLTDLGGGAFELNNLAVEPAFHRRGYGRAMLALLAERCRAAGGRRLLAGTGDSPLTLPFYAACGFVEVGRVAGYFPAHYDHPIYEGGKELKDLVRLELRL